MLGIGAVAGLAGIIAVVLAFASSGPTGRVNQDAMIGGLLTIGVGGQVGFAGWIMSLVTSSSSVTVRF